MEKLTKGELVDLNEEFIEIVPEFYKSNFNKRYVMVNKTEEHEYCLEDFDTEEELKNHIRSNYEDPDGSSWFIHMIYDLVEKKEIHFKVEVKVTLT